MDRDAYMALLWFKNGSLTRERIRDSCAEGLWKLFNELINSMPQGNFGNVGKIRRDVVLIFMLHYSNFPVYLHPAYKDVK
jgi:hypothetical protein